MDLFAVSKSHPFALHAWGSALFINGAKVVDVTAVAIWIETRPDEVNRETGEVIREANRLRIGRRKPVGGATLIWEL